MKPDRLAEFPLSPHLTMLNHASFGVVSTRVMGAGDALRAELEADSHALVDIDALIPRVRRATHAAARHLSLAAESLALTQNATSGASAIIRSLPLRPGARIVVLATEYTSIIRGWKVRAEEVGATVLCVVPPLPMTSVEQLLNVLERDVTGPVDIAQLSVVSSATATHLPIEPVASWFRDRGATVVLDAAHGPGHVPLHPREWGVAAMFGNVHKWFPTPRPVGFVWLDESLRDVVRPAIVSLTWDSPDLVERFEWPGTYDPVPRLCVEPALAQWSEWDAAGHLDEAARLADVATKTLAAVGAIPTADGALCPPRLRAYLVPSWSREELRDTLHANDIRAWTGLGPRDDTILRVATHIYTDESDIDRLASVLATHP